MDCDRDRHPPNKREGRMPHHDERSVSECHENWAKPASRARFARGLRAGAVEDGLLGLRAPQKTAIIRSG